MTNFFQRAVFFAENQPKSAGVTHDWSLSQLQALALLLAQTHDQALSSAAHLARSYAAECCGGSGAGGEGYLNLANAIEKLRE